MTAKNFDVLIIGFIVVMPLGAYRPGYVIEQQR